MSTWLERLAERQMQKAVAANKLQNLAGEGKPLPDHPEEAFVSAGDAAGFRIMAEAGALPEEIVIKKQILALRQELASLTSEDERRAMLVRIAGLETKKAIAEEARRRFLKG